MGSVGVSKKEMAHAHISWFEIPAIDIYRAAAFYSGLFGIELEVVPSGDYQMAFLPSTSTPSGALVCGQGMNPSSNGVLVYLNCDPDVAVPLAKVEGLGGRLVMDKTFLGEESGYFGVIIDTEGNKVALRSRT